MLKVQNHIHKKDPKTGKRKPLPACIRPSHPNECKGGFPKTKQLNTQAAVICPGLAKHFGRTVKGKRNDLGAIQGARNDEAINGTAQGFVTIYGFNTDTQPNDRVPLLAETHDSRCKKNCLKKASTLRIARKAQCAQTNTTGYFTGYTVKPQPVGRYEQMRAQNAHSQG